MIDNSFGSLFEIHGGVGATRIEGVGADSQFIVELFNGVGGFVTAGDAFAALKDDGAGGLSLALGSSGTIDFAGAAAGSIGAGNFKIG